MSCGSHAVTELGKHLSSPSARPSSRADPRRAIRAGTPKNRAPIRPRQWGNPPDGQFNDRAIVRTAPRTGLCGRFRRARAGGRGKWYRAGLRELLPESVRLHPVAGHLRGRFTGWKSSLDPQARFSWRARPRTGLPEKIDKKVGDDPMGFALSRVRTRHTRPRVAPWGKDEQQIGRIPRSQR